jgi:hypothetical protein
VLAYIQAWDVMRMMANRHTVSAPVTYLLVPSAGDGNGNGNGHSRQSGNGDYRRSEATTAVPRLATPPAVGAGSRPATSRNAVAAGVPLPAAANGGSAGIPFRGQVTRGQVAVGVHPVAAPPVKASVAAPSSPAAGVKFDNGQNGVATAVAVPKTDDAPARPADRDMAEIVYGPASLTPAEPEAVTSAPQLCYQDGSLVDLGKTAEVETFRRFVAEKNEAPASKAALQEYYRQQKAS